MPVAPDELKAFLFAANQAGFAGGDAKSWVSEPDQSTSIVFEYGAWRMHDNFFGGEPYGGREVVFFNDRPVWIMTYYGWVTSPGEPDSVYGLLRRALQAMSPDSPFRGPARYDERPFTYVNTWRGGIERLGGEEQIEQDGCIVYTGRYLGGWVDARRAV